jgi:hypothetical protein
MFSLTGEEEVKITPLKVQIFNEKFLGFCIYSESGLIQIQMTPKEYIDLLGSIELMNGLKCIEIAEYDQFKKDSKLLDKLYAAGVDNWEGYNQALESED